MLDAKCEKLATALKEANSIVIYTGAGISTVSEKRSFFLVVLIDICWAISWNVPQHAEIFCSCTF